MRKEQRKAHSFDIFTIFIITYKILASKKSHFIKPFLFNKHRSLESKNAVSTFTFSRFFLDLLPKA